MNVPERTARNRSASTRERTTESQDPTPAALIAAGGAISQKLDARREEIVRGIYAHIQTTVPEPTTDANRAYQAGLRATITDLVEYSLQGIAAGGHWRAPIPNSAAEQARRAARTGVTLGMVLRRYLAAHARLGEYVTEQANRNGLSNDGRTLQHLSRTQAAMLDHLTAAMEVEYNDETEILRRSPTQRHARLVHRLLNYEQPTTVELGELGYGLDGAWHIGVIAAGANADQALRTVGRALSCQVLGITADDGTLWAWLGMRARFPAAGVAAHLPADSAARILVGEPRHGTDGWRRTHQEVRAAWPAALHATTTVTFCVDITLTAALLADSVLARLHRDTFLTPLDGQRDGGHISRETLHAYFACERSIASASAMLNVTRRTVENRLASIAKVLDRPLHSCLAELEVALRLEALIPGERKPDSPNEASNHVRA
jgi:hypothetical protein